MNKLALVAATALTAGLSLSAQAQYNSHAEARGYDQCLEAAQAEMRATLGPATDTLLALLRE